MQPTIPKTSPNKKSNAFICILLVLQGASACIHFNVTALVLALLSCVGIYVCSLLVLYLLDKNNPLTAKWCSAKGSFDCGKVLESGKFSRHIHLGDVGLVYFMGQFLFLLLSTVNRQLPTAFLLLGFPAALAAVVGIFSVCYQGLVVKSWCKMCLAIVGTLWLQALVLVGYFLFTKGNIFTLNMVQLFPAAFMYACSLLAASCWFAVPPIMAKAAEAENLRKQNLRWKKDGGLFLAMLQKQRTVDAAVWENDFVLGNGSASVKMIEAVNLYCPACARQHRQLHHLLSENSKGFQLVLRFKNTGKEDSKHTIALRYILNAYFSTTTMEEKLAIMVDWYETMDLQKWRQKWPNVKIADNHEGLAKQYTEWFARTEIQHTPTLFLNGREFPKPYVMADLRTLAKPLLTVVAQQRNAQKTPVQPHEI